MDGDLLLGRSKLCLLLRKIKEGPRQAIVFAGSDGYSGLPGMDEVAGEMQALLGHEAIVTGGWISGEAAGFTS